MSVLLKVGQDVNLQNLLTHPHYLAIIQNHLNRHYLLVKEVAVAQEHMLLEVVYHTQLKKLHYRKAQYLQ